MRSLRIAAFALWLAVVTPPFTLVAVLVCWLPLRWSYRAVGQWNRCALWGLRRICGIRHRVLGLENLPGTPCVICSKHQSAWETIAFYAFMPPSSYVVKRSLLMVPFFGWGLWLAMGPIPIDRSSPSAALRSVLKIGAERLKVGFSVVIFPEGTRIPVGESRKFLPSAATLAAQNGVPLIPVALNSGLCWPPNGLDLRPGEVTVSIGPAIGTAGRRSREALDEARDWIAGETERLGG